MEKVHLAGDHVIIIIDWQYCLLAVCLKAYRAWRSLLEELRPLLRLSRLSDKLLERLCCPPGDTWPLLILSRLLPPCSSFWGRTNQICLLCRSSRYPPITQHRDSLHWAGWSLLACYSRGPKRGLVWAEPLLVSIAPQSILERNRLTPAPLALQRKWLWMTASSQLHNNNNNNTI